MHGTDPSKSQPAQRGAGNGLTLVWAVGRRGRRPGQPLESAPRTTSPRRAVELQPEAGEEEAVAAAAAEDDDKVGSKLSEIAARMRSFEQRLQVRSMASLPASWPAAAQHVETLTQLCEWS